MGLAAVWSFVLPLALVAPRLRWFRLSLSLVRVRLWFWSFCVCGGFVSPNYWFAFGVSVIRFRRWIAPPSAWR